MENFVSLILKIKYMTEPTIHSIRNLRLLILSEINYTNAMRLFALFVVNISLYQP